MATKTETLWLHFHDEVRGISCGRRRVEIKRKGDYVYLREIGIVKRRWSKMLATCFDEIFKDWLPMKKKEVHA